MHCNDVKKVEIHMYVVSQGHRTIARGSGGMLPQGKFEFLGYIRSRGI